MSTVTVTAIRPSKRRRLASAAATPSSDSEAKRHSHGRSTIRLLPAHPTVGLQDLPAELLNIILDVSFEASLIHVSRQLRAKLPPFVPFTQSLAFQALLPLNQWRDIRPIECARASDIAHWLSSLDSNTQSIIREKAFSTYWLNEERMNMVRQSLLNWTIVKTCTDFFLKSPCPSQTAKIRAFVEKQQTPVVGSDLNLRLKCENNALTYLTVTPFAVEVSESCNSLQQAFEFRVVDFGNRVPDFLLQHPLTPAKRAMLTGICQWRGTKRSEIRCNLELLAKSILHCIDLDQLTTFYDLLRLAASTGVVLDLVHIERAVALGRWRMLTPLLKHAWRQQSLCRLVDVDLRRLIDEAKVNGYPNSNDTTRILAMEVAALWKIAEVRGAGGTVSRLFTQWPPRLAITMPGQKHAQVWYIPKDPRHEVDWESSEFWAWIQRRMYMAI